MPIPNSNLVVMIEFIDNRLHLDGADQHEQFERILQQMKDTQLTALHTIVLLTIASIQIGVNLDAIHQLDGESITIAGRIWRELYPDMLETAIAAGLAATQH